MFNKRRGCKDIWNSFMVAGADFSQSDYDIPFCPTTAKVLPTNILTWREAIKIYNTAIRNKNYDFKYPAFVCWYEDDYKFDGKGGIWNEYKNVLEIVRHFEGIITPDFSTYQDFPLSVKIYNTYRMRAYGYWIGLQGMAVYNNARWGTSETFSFTFDGLPENDILVIGTVGGSPAKIEDRDRFENGLKELIERKQPKGLIIYGSSNYPCFKELEEIGITIYSYKSSTAKAFEKRGNHEQRK